MPPGSSVLIGVNSPPTSLYSQVFKSKRYLVRQKKKLASFPVNVTREKHWKITLPARKFQRHAPAGPLIARYGTFIALRMQNPKLTREKKMATQRNIMIITCRPVFNFFTMCGKTVKKK